MILIAALLNDLTMIAISRDTVAPSPTPEQWHLYNLFIRAMLLGGYMALSTIIFFVVLWNTTFFPDHFDVTGNFHKGTPFRTTNDPKLHMLIYLQCRRVENKEVSLFFSHCPPASPPLTASIIGQAAVFSARNLGSWRNQRLPSWPLIGAFVFAQLVATFIAVYADWPFTRVVGIGWNYAGIAWVWCMIWYLPMHLLDILLVQLQLNWRSWFNYPHHGLQDTQLLSHTHLRSTRHHHHPRHNRPGRAEANVLAGRARARAGLTATNKEREVRRRGASLGAASAPPPPPDEGLVRRPRGATVAAMNADRVVLNIPDNSKLPMESVV